MSTVKVGGEEIRLEPFSGLKATWLMQSLEAIGTQWPEIFDKLAEFTTAYESKNVRALDRTTARAQFAPEPLMDEEPILMEDGSALTDQHGQVLVRRTPKLGDDGRPVMGPDPLGHMTEEDWQASGNKLRLPRSPSGRERLMAILPVALKLGKDQVLQVLALVAMPEAELDNKEADGSLEDYLVTRGRQLLKAPLRDLIKLAAAAGEMVEQEMRDTSEQLSGELPNVARLLGIDPSSLTSGAPESEPSTSRQTSSTDSPTPTDGSPEPSSAPVGASSSPSDAD